MNTEHERLSWTRFQAELIKRTMRRLRANPDFARERVWVHNKLEFHQQKLSNLLAEIERMDAALNELAS
jgi:hypothetical protein